MRETPEGCLSVRGVVFVKPPKLEGVAPEGYGYTMPKRFTIERIYRSSLEDAVKHMSAWRDANDEFGITGTFTVTL